MDADDRPTSARKKAATPAPSGSKSAKTKPPAKKKAPAAKTKASASKKKATASKGKGSAAKKAEKKPAKKSAKAEKPAKGAKAAKGPKGSKAAKPAKAAKAASKKPESKAAAPAGKKKATKGSKMPATGDAKPAATKKDASAKKPAPKKPPKKAAPASNEEVPSPSRKDAPEVAAHAITRPKATKAVTEFDDDLSPVRSSKTSGPLVRVTGSLTRPPLEVTRTGTPAVLPPGEHPSGTGTPAVIGTPPHRLPPEVRPDPSILNLDENRGALSAHGYRLVLMHPESLIEIQMALEEKIGLEAGQMIFRGGYVIGLREARRLKDADCSEDQIVQKVADRCAAHGWGIFKVENLDLWRHELIFRVDHSPFAYAYGKSTTGVDHMIRGVFSGVCEVIFDKKVVATESMCRAMGDAYCQFMVG